MGTPRSLVPRARRRVGSLLLRAGVAAKSLVQDRLAAVPPLDPPLSDAPRQFPAVVYFADPPLRFYQLAQWLPVLESVTSELPVLVVTRHPDSAARARATTSLPVQHAETLDALATVYEHFDPKVILYVNNGWLNFQSLMHRRAVHAHVNHGESDKISMVSNQVKAYDRVLVAGHAAIERHRRALIDFDLKKLVVGGRPQLDLEITPTLRRAPGLRTVLYAPTWSGENEANNYTSIDRYGTAIVAALLADPAVRLVYKPHPRVLDSSVPEVARAHRAIMTAISRANVGRTAPHETALDVDILSLFEAADLLVTDISSVGLDFLYLYPERPIVLTDRRNDRERLVAESPIAGGASVIDDVSRLDELFRDELAHDPREPQRRIARDLYFSLPRGKSLPHFVQFLRRTARERDDAVSRLADGESSDGAVTTGPERT